MSTAEWTGVPLVEVLDRAGVKANAREVVFRGADSGNLDARSEPIRFERSLSLDDARGSEALLAYAMNGEALPIQHGYPLRLVVPSWYAVASVKWLTEIDVISQPFTGRYQTEAYFFEWQRGRQLVREPVSLQRVRSLITEPEPDTELEQGELRVRGVAWSGAAAIAQVEVNIGGAPWQNARLLGERKRHSWQCWELVARLGQRVPHSFPPGKRIWRAEPSPTCQSGIASAMGTMPFRKSASRFGRGCHEPSLCLSQEFRKPTKSSSPMKSRRPRFFSRC